MKNRIFGIISLLQILSTPVVLGGESSSSHPFPQPGAFTLVFFEAEPTSEGLEKYQKDIQWTEKVLSEALNEGSLVAFSKRIIPLTKKKITPEPEKNLYTLCAQIKNIETSSSKPGTYFQVLSKVQSGIEMAGIRLVEGSSCNEKEIQKEYSEIYWADKVVGMEYEDPANVRNIYCTGSDVTVYTTLNPGSDGGVVPNTWINVVYKNQISHYVVDAELSILESVEYRWKFVSPRGFSLKIQTSEKGPDLRGVGTVILPQAPAALALDCKLKTYPG